MQPLHPIVQLQGDGLHGLGLALRLNNIVAFGVDGKPRVLLLDGAEERIDLGQRLNLIAEHFNAVGVLVVGGEDLNHVAAYAEGATAEVHIVALVEDLNEPAGDVLAADLLALFEQEQHAVVGLRRTQAVDATDRAHDDGVAALKERTRGREAQLVQLLVDGGFLLDIEVAGRNVGLRLIVVVVADEVFDRVRGEELLELVVELGGEGLVVSQNQRRAIRLLDDLGHGEGFAGAGNAEQHLMFFAVQEPLDELVDGAGLIAARLIMGDELKVHAGIIARNGENLANKAQHNDRFGEVRSILQPSC